MKDFEILESLGQGSYASVFKVRRHQDHQIYALKKVKILQLSEKQKQNALNQVRLLASIKSPHIISYRDAFLDKQTNSLCLITQFADDGDLEQLISKHKNQKTKIQQNKIWSVFTQIAKALKTLHFANIVHRDLKSANIFLFKDGRVKLGDMNVSKVLRDRLCFTQTGTPYYASPQIWKDQPYNQKSDIWSLGCITYEMAALEPPFKSKSMQGLYKKIIKGIYPKLSKQYTNNLKNVIRKMLQVDMNYRPAAQTLLLSSVNTNRTQIENNQESQDDEIKLLETIKTSKKHLRICLPKPNYQMKKKISLRILPSIDNHRGMQKYKTISSILSPKYLSQGLLPLLKIRKQ